MGTGCAVEPSRDIKPKVTGERAAHLRAEVGIAEIANW
jgi:hypothetical protein